jgi:hypothetical protein
MDGGDANQPRRGCKQLIIKLMSDARPEAILRRLETILGLKMVKKRPKMAKYHQK